MMEENKKKSNQTEQNKTKNSHLIFQITYSTEVS